MDRRTFLTSTSIAVPSIMSITTPNALGARSQRPSELRADLVVVGGGLGGCAAALGALRNGLQVILTEETDWIGGQMTQQAVPPDEHPWVESFGTTQIYRELRNRIREYYRRNYPLTGSAQEVVHLNPGNGGVSRLCHEPRVALAVLYEMLAPYISGARLTLLIDHKPVSAETDGDRVNSVTVRSLETGNETVLWAPYFIDATELGELLPLTDTEYVTGFESQDQTGELHAPSSVQPENMQACTWCFAMDYIQGGDHTIEKPEMYDFWRDYVPELTPPWPGKQLSWTYTHPITLKPITRYCDPVEESGFWHYRRIADHGNFIPGTYPSSITLVNWPQNDYLLGNLYDIPEDRIEKHLSEARQLSLSLLYWMQTEAPRPDGGTGWPGLRLRGDICGTEHGLAKYPYIRESRRIKAEFTVLEHHVGTEARMERTGKPRDEVTAESFADSVGVGSYRIDLHPSTGGDNYIDVSSLPFQIPLGSLIPQRVENLLAGCKNLGVTHITNGCYRLHPVEWNIGESAGALVAYCIEKKERPSGVRNTKNLLDDFQGKLRSQGVEIAWPRVTPR